MSSLVNEVRLFDAVMPYVGNKNRIVEELIENSCRSGADNVEIELSEDGVLTCTDDGSGVKDWMSVFQVATTNYSPEVMENQRPAGMGVMLMLSASTKAVFVSNGEAIEIVSDKFFSDPSYRDWLVSSIESGSLEKASGSEAFKVELTLKDGMVSVVRDIVEQKNEYRDTTRMSLYPINISLNSHGIKRNSIEWVVSVSGDGAVAGTTVGIDKDLNGAVIWHGKYIQCPELRPFVVDVTGKTPELTPSLPDRTRIDNPKDDLKRLRAEIESQLFDVIQSAMSDDDGNVWGRHLVGLHKKYDVSHWSVWGLVVEYLYGARRFKPTWFKADNNEGKIVYTQGTEMEIELDGREMPVDVREDMGENFIKVASRINNTPAPDAVKKLLNDEIVFTASGARDREYSFGCSNLRVVDSISLNGLELDSVVFEVGGDGWLTDDLQGFFDVDDLSQYFPDWTGEGEMEDNIARVFASESQCVPSNDYSNLLWSLAGLVGHDVSIKSFSCDCEAKLIDVTLSDGSTKSVKVA